MYHHIKKLMYTVQVGMPDPRFGNMLARAVWRGKRRAGRGDAVFHSGP